jgi:hypothetical protein
MVTFHYIAVFFWLESIHRSCHSQGKGFTKDYNFGNHPGVCHLPLPHVPALVSILEETVSTYLCRECLA